MIVLNKLTKTYREGGVTRPVLSDLSLLINDAEFVAIHGASGSGKSTLLNLIAGLDPPDSGSIEINGELVSHLNDHDRTLFRRRHIGFVFQFFSLIPALTVAENVALGLELNGLERRIPDRVPGLLDQLGLGDRGASYPDRLSGGEQQRVAIARAVAHRPALVLADEPTGNLDSQTESAVLALLEDACRTSNTTLLVATHSDAVAARADRVIRIDGTGEARCA